jgi:hypothetical protein
LQRKCLLLTQSGHCALSGALFVATIACSRL